MRDFLELFFGGGIMGVLVFDRSQYMWVLADRMHKNIPGWYFRAPVLYAFFSSCSVAVGETYKLWLATF